MWVFLCQWSNVIHYFSWDSKFVFVTQHVVKYILSTYGDFSGEIENADDSNCVRKNTQWGPLSEVQYKL